MRTDLADGLPIDFGPNATANASSSVPLYGAAERSGFYGTVRVPLAALALPVAEGTQIFASLR